MNTHHYKVWPRPYQAILWGDKRFEWRIDDRVPRPEVGDLYIGREWDPNNRAYTGSLVKRRITYTLRGEFGMPQGWVVFGIARGASPSHPIEDLTGRQVWLRLRHACRHMAIDSELCGYSTGNVALQCTMKTCPRLLDGSHRWGE